MFEDDALLAEKARARRAWASTSGDFQSRHQMKEYDSMKTVYDADGKAYEVEPVDAREYLETGRYFASKPEPKPAEPPKPEPKKA